MAKILIEISNSLLATARRLADQRGLSVEQYLSTIVIEQLRREWWRERTSGDASVTRDRFLEILAKAPDVPPMPGDEIDPQ